MAATYNNNNHNGKRPNQATALGENGGGLVDEGAPLLSSSDSLPPISPHRRQSNSTTAFQNMRHQRNCSSLSSSGGLGSDVNDPDLQRILQHPENELFGSTRNLNKYQSQFQQQQNQQGAVIGETVRYYLGQHIDPHGRGDGVFHMKSGSLQQSLVVACVIAMVNGVACWLYYVALNWTLHFVWKDLPQQPQFALFLSTTSAWLWVPMVIVVAAAIVGGAVVYLGEPGDMSFTVACVHSEDAYIPMPHVIPMVVASFWSIVGAGSLGPEAPLVAICGALAGGVSRSVFHETHSAVIRKHTLMGMAGALAAFFGAPLGGSLFALEVNSRFGLEYYEHVSESIFCGELTLIVFRTLTGESVEPLWNLGVPKLEQAQMSGILLGAALGLVGAGMAYVFALFHTQVMNMMNKLDLLDNKRAIWRAMIGAIGIITTGLLIPQTLFWSENEFQVVATRGPASALPHVWPTDGLIGYETDTALKTALVGVVKLIAISFTIAGGFRGGFIFPLIMAGGAVGRAISDWTGFPLQLGVLCVAAGLNVAITRTALATTLVLVVMSDEIVAIPAVLMASLCSLFATGYLVFIKTQLARSDIDHSIFHVPPGARSDDEASDSE